MINLADVLGPMGGELENRLRWLLDEERRLAAAAQEVHDERMRQEGAIDCFKLIAKRLADAPEASDAKEA